MKRLLKITFFLFLLLIVALAAAPFFIPLDSVKKIASEKVKEATGRDLLIAGDIKASLWPNIGVTLNKVSLSNPEGFSHKNMAEIESLTVGVELLPLLHKEVKISKFIIEKPIINLEKNKQNKTNWIFSPQTEAKESAESSSTKPTAAGALLLGKIEIKDGKFSYSDALSGKSYNAEKATLDIDMPSLNSPLNLNAKLNINGKNAKILLYAEEPAKLAAGEKSKAKAYIVIDSLLSLNFTGTADKESAAGNIKFNSPSLLKIAEFAGPKIAFNAESKLPLDIEGSINCNEKECSFSKSTFASDENKLSGDLKINFAGATPAIKAALTSDKLDINPFLPQSQKSKEKQSSLFISNAFAAEQKAGWSSEPIDLSGLKGANADISLNLGELLYRKISVKKLALNLKLAGGKLDINVPHCELYEGTAKLSASLDAGGSIAANIETDKIGIEPLLTELADFDRLTGTSSANISVTGHGASQKEIISSLNGNGKIQIADGTIKGVDIAKIITSSRAMITGKDTYSDKTKFSELGGSFNIKQGIVSNNDLMMKAPLLRLKGEGTVDLPNRFVQYLLTPSVVATLQGQGGKEKEGLDIPVKVEGNFESLKFTPDVGGIIQKVTEDPQKLKETVKDLKGSAKELKKSLKDPENIKNLLNNFR